MKVFEKKTIRPILMLTAVILSVLTAVAFSTDISVSSFSKHDNIRLADNTLLWSLLTISLSCIYYRVFVAENKKSDCICVGVVSLAFGVLNVIGHSLYYLDSWDFIFGNSYQFLLGTMCALGYAGVFYCGGLILYRKLDTSRKNNCDCNENFFIKTFNEHPRLVCSIVIAFILFLWLVIYFPGYTNNDLNYQLRQFYGKDPLTNSHPVLSTLIMGSCMSLGKMIGSDNLGLFFYMLLQSAVFVYAFGSVCKLAGETKLGFVLRVIFLAFYSLLPVWGAYSVQAMKDGLFTGIFTIYIVRCTEGFIQVREGNDLSRMYLIRLTVISVLTCLLRSAVSFIVIPSLLLLAISLKKKKEGLKIFISALISGSISLGIIYVLLPAIGVIKCNRAESLSIPFQQTARIVRDHNEGLTQDEKNVINEVLDYESLSSVYLPVLSDPVKDTYKQRELPSEKKTISEFMKVWKTLVKRYPDTALQATLANTYGYFSFTPSIQTSNGHTGMCFFLSDDKNDGSISTDTYTIHYPNVLKPIRKLVLTVSYLLDAVPGINLLYACAFYFWFIVLLTVYVVSRGGFRNFALLSAGLLLQLGCLGSSVNDCFRYEAPIVAALPVFLIAALYVSGSDNIDAETSLEN